MADVNGDGKVDAVAYYVEAGGWWTSVAFSIGDGTFAPRINTQHDATAYSTNWKYSMADVNGDGKADVIVNYVEPSGPTGWYSRVALSKGDGTYAAFVETTHTATNPLSTFWEPIMADVNGDGRMDAAINYADSAGWLTRAASALGGTQLLTSLANGLGGATTIQYVPSTQYVNTLLPFPVQTVSSLTKCDNWDSVNKICPPTGIASTTTYSYTAGYHQIGERDFRGFKTAVVTSPGLTDADKTVTTTWFHQGNELNPIDTESPGLANGYMKGKPYRVEIRRKSDNYLFAKTETTYLADQIGSNTTAPWFTPVKQVDTTIENGAKTTRVVYADASFTGYDVYGNVTQIRHLGDISTSTDDSTTVITFGNADTTNWLLAFPTAQSTYAGLGTTGTKLTESKYFYDVANSCTTPAGNLIPSKGHVTKVERYLDQGGTNPISGMQYNIYGSLTCTRDPLGNQTNLAYDTATSTFPLTNTNALGHVTTTAYYGVNNVVMDTGLYGQVKNVTDPNAKTTTSTYDALGQLLTTTTPDTPNPLVSTMTYNYGGTFVVGTQNIQSTISGGGLSASLVSKTYFDGLGRTIKKENPGAADGGASLKVLVTETQYDVRGLVKQTSLPYLQGTESATGRWTVLTYDALGRTTQVTPPDNAYSRVCYNAWTTTTIDPKRHKKVETKDALSRLVTVQEYTGTQVDCTTTSGTLYTTTTYAYNLVGNLLSVTDAKGNLSSMTYDTLGRKLSMHDPDMGNWFYTYDTNGNLLTQVNAMNQKVCFSYDALNRRTQKNFGTTTVACGTNTVVYAYDDTVTASNGKGRLKQVTDPAQSVTFQYDSRGRIKQSAKTLDGTTYTTTSVYDGLGRLTTVNYPTTPINTVTYTYDGPQLKQVTEGATNYVTYAGWNALGQTATATFGNGVVTTMTYANTNNTTCSQQTFRLCTLKTQKGVNPLYQDLRYDYESNGNVWNIYDATVAANAGDQHFAYDDLDRLTLANGPYGASGANATFSYSYNEIGNLTLNSQLSLNTYIYPTSGSSSVRPHAVSTAGANSYTYDANGNMLTGAGRTYTWNPENKPLTIVQGGTTTTFVYDGDGARVKKVVGTTTTRYIHKLYECDNTNCSRFVWAGSMRIATIASSGIVNYWHGDHLGSSSVITDSTGAKVENITYYPYGGTRTNTSPSTPAIDVPYKYTGKELDSTGLYYYEARYYDPTLARFISADTIVESLSNPQVLNRYSYVGNNPLRYTDPTGHCFLGICFSKSDLNTLKTVGGVVAEFIPGLQPLGIYLLTTTQTGRYILAGEILVGTAAASFYCGGCGAWAEGAAIGAWTGAAVGGYSAARNGGDLSSGILFGSATGAATGAFAAYVAPTGELFNFLSYTDKIIVSAKAGAILGAGAGATDGYAGNKGTIGDILKGTAIGAGTGAITAAGLEAASPKISQLLLKAGDIKISGDMTLQQLVDFGQGSIHPGIHAESRFNELVTNIGQFLEANRMPIVWGGAGLGTGAVLNNQVLPLVQRLCPENSPCTTGGKF
jgi:RHS repeat-associated protein